MYCHTDMVSANIVISRKGFVYSIAASVNQVIHRNLQT